MARTRGHPPRVHRRSIRNAVCDLDCARTSFGTVHRTSGVVKVPARNGPTHGHLGGRSGISRVPRGCRHQTPTTPDRRTATTTGAVVAGSPVGRHDRPQVSLALDLYEELRRLAADPQTGIQGHAGHLITSQSAHNLRSWRIAMTGDFPTYSIQTTRETMGRVKSAPPAPLRCTGHQRCACTGFDLVESPHARNQFALRTPLHPTSCTPPSSGEEPVELGSAGDPGRRSARREPV